jgi:hypothetical protein
MKKVIGWAMILAPVLVIFIASGIATSWSVATVTFLAGLVGLILVVVGAILVFDE